MGKKEVPIIGAAADALEGALTQTGVLCTECKRPGEETMTEVLMVLPPVAEGNGGPATVRIGHAYLCGRNDCGGVVKALKDPHAVSYRVLPAWQLINGPEEAA